MKPNNSNSQRLDAKPIKSRSAENRNSNEEKMPLVSIQSDIKLKLVINEIIDSYNSIIQCKGYNSNNNRLISMKIFINNNEFENMGLSYETFAWKYMNELMQEDYTLRPYFVEYDEENTGLLSWGEFMTTVAFRNKRLPNVSRNDTDLVDTIEGKINDIIRYVYCKDICINPITFPKGKRDNISIGILSTYNNDGITLSEWFNTLNDEILSDLNTLTFEPLINKIASSLILVMNCIIKLNMNKINHNYMTFDNILFKDEPKDYYIFSGSPNEEGIYNQILFHSKIQIFISNLSNTYIKDPDERTHLNNKGLDLVCSRGGGCNEFSDLHDPWVFIKSLVKLIHELPETHRILGQILYNFLVDIVDEQYTEEFFKEEENGYDHHYTDLCNRMSNNDWACGTTNSDVTESMRWLRNILLTSIKPMIIGLKEDYISIKGHTDGSISFRKKYLKYKKKYLNLKIKIVGHKI
jgi:hypothetical protein